MKNIKIALAAALMTGLSISATEAVAQKSRDSKSKGTAVKWSKTASGLEYAMVKDVPGNNPKIGDHLEMHIRTYVGDSILFESRKLNANKPVPFQVAPSNIKGDLVEGLMMMSPGDSALFKVSVDSLKKSGAQLLPWMKEGDKVSYEVTLVSMKSPEDMKKEQDAKLGIQMQADEALLAEYFTKNKLKPTKTASGLYYTITKQGEGPVPNAGDNITVNYTGTTVDGKPFDSNVDPAFHHVQPFSFAVGNGQVIKGWDEGLMLLNKGSKATFYIPSGLAYGERSPSAAIPENSILIFDVEVTEIGATPPPPPPAAEHSKDDGHNH
jgi:FKBP-type peptidyl-prolyl cis-trans isomerase FkpA